MCGNEPIYRSRSALSRPLCVGILAFAAAASSSRAGEIFKSVGPDGNVVYSDHLDPSLSQSSLVQLDEERPAPSQLHFCWTNCFTLILDNGVYRRTDGTAETWTVEIFSADALVLHRHDTPADWNGFSADVVYAGKISNDRLVAVTVNGKPTSGIDASFGGALNTLPGSNAERDGASPAAAATPDAAPIDSISSATEPPPVPEEDQPPLPEDGLLWTPGYWYWRDRVYVWIPGLWARPPRVGDLWTPAYWSTAGAVFVFRPGHWAPTVGFYGGVDHGYGYFGNGYTGGHWVGNAFAYNSAVNRVSPAVVHQYSQSGLDHAPVVNQRYPARPRSGDPIHAASAHVPSAVSIDKVADAGAVNRPADVSQPAAKAERPAVIVKTATPGPASKSTRAIPTAPTR